MLRSCSAADCLQSLAQAGIRCASWLVVDHFGLDAAWETQLLASLAGAAPPSLLVIDDLADRPHQARYWGLCQALINLSLDRCARSQATFARAGFAIDPIPLTSAPSRAETRLRWTRSLMGGPTPTPPE